MDGKCFPLLVGERITDQRATEVMFSVVLTTAVISIFNLQDGQVIHVIINGIYEAKNTILQLNYPVI